MKKPEKRNGNFDNTPWCSACGKSEDFCTCEGYNDCCDAVEKWLPNVEEIETILTLTGYGSSIKEKARAIANRLEIK